MPQDHGFPPTLIREDPLLKYCSVLCEAVGLVGEKLDVASMCMRLSVILKRPLGDLERAFSSDSVLLSAGLIAMRKAALSLDDKVQVAEGLVDKLLSAHTTSDDALSLFLNRAPKTVLSKEDFTECDDQYEIVSAYMKAVVENKHKGVNVLIYGAPGVGKTQMVRSICEELSVSLFEVPDEDTDGDACSPGERFSAYRLCQKILERHGRSAVLFDEIEDVFPIKSPWGGMRTSIGRSMGGKSWINRMLESNQAPTFWLGNTVSHMDPAYLRRFDLIIEVPRPSESMRKRVLKKFLVDKGIAQYGWLDRAADSPFITPGIIEKTVRVIRAIDADESRAAQLYERLTGGTLKAMGFETPRVPEASSLISYDLGVINTDADPEGLVQGVGNMGEGRVLLYGAPGTGKTEWARYLARSLDKPLVIRKPSDILGKYVGETEKNLATAFDEAKDQGAVLLLDEIDSFLRTRRAESRGWEISQVNELLVQIESFKGVLVASTNAFTMLDEAALRRFDVKVRFDFMTAEQVRKLFYQVLDGEGQVSVEGHDLIDRRLSRLDMLSPGDFHAVLRRLKITGVAVNGSSLCKALEEECARKTEYRGRPIGFSAQV